METPKRLVNEEYDDKCKVEVWSRVTGFFRPVDGWNKGKKKEFEDRKHFEVK